MLVILLVLTCEIVSIAMRFHKRQGVANIFWLLFDLTNNFDAIRSQCLLWLLSKKFVKVT